MHSIAPEGSPGSRRARVDPRRFARNLPFPWGVGGNVGRGLRTGLGLAAALLVMGTGFPLFVQGLALVNRVPGIAVSTVATQVALFVPCVAFAAWLALLKAKAS